MLCHSLTRGWRTEGGSTQFSARHHQPGTCISLRVPARRSFSVEDRVASGSLTPGAAQFLSRMIEAKLAFLISRGIGSGKRTLAL